MLFKSFFKRVESCYEFYNVWKRMIICTYTVKVICYLKALLWTGRSAKWRRTSIVIIYLYLRNSPYKRFFSYSISAYFLNLYLCHWYGKIKWVFSAGFVLFQARLRYSSSTISLGQTFSVKSTSISESRVLFQLLLSLIINLAKR